MIYLVWADFYRHNGVEANAGKTWLGQDALRAEKDDVRGGRKRIKGHDQLQRLPEHDAGQKKRNTETVSMTHCGFEKVKAGQLHSYVVVSRIGNDTYLFVFKDPDV